MGRGGHGTGLIGNSHSHNNDYPDEVWNLYQFIKRDETLGFNINGCLLDIFKPQISKFDKSTLISSDTDEEILLAINFTNPIFLKGLSIIGGENPDNSPYNIKLFPNKYIEDFDEAKSTKSPLEINLEYNQNGEAIVNTNTHFQYIISLTILVYNNQGDEEETIISYIGLKGEHTHDKREAVNTMYEIANHVNTEQPVYDEKYNENII